VLSLLLSGGDFAENGMSPLLAPSDRALFLLGSSGAVPVWWYGRWWTILSAGWLHANILHIGMNMLGARQLAPLTADIFGPGRAIIIYVLSGACGFALSSVGIFIPIPFLGGAGYTVGASAPLCGMLGALMAYSRMGGSSMLGAQVKSWILSMAIFGLLFRGIDNYAHAGGFIGGYLVARWMNPFKPERLDHLIWGLLCLLITFLAILASVLYGLPFVRPDAQ
jgi:rhomboid protease GluP